jgi:hypothetical protein
MKAIVASLSHKAGKKHAGTREYFLASWPDNAGRKLAAKKQE